MARNSAGVMTVPTQLVAGTPALASDVMNDFNDIGQEITDSLSRSGKGGMQSHLAMGGFRITGLAEPVNAGDAVSKGYADELAVDLTPILESIGANFGTAANKGLYTTAANTAAEFALTAAGRALLDDADAAAQRITIGIATGLAADQGKVFYLNATGLLTLLAVGTAGQVLTSGGAGANPAWATVGGVPNVVFEHQAAGSGGNATAGFSKRTLNTTVRNTGGFASIAASVITLTAGRYYVEFSAPAFSCRGHQAKFYQSSAPITDRILGSSEYSSQAGDTATQSVGAGEFTISATETFELQHAVQDASGDASFGESAASGLENVYSRVKIWRI